MPKSQFVDFKAVKAAITMEQVLQHYGLLEKFKRGQDSLNGPCPIHKGSNPTQFRVSLSKNIWNCFSECKHGGNTLDFIAEMENVSIHAAALKAIEWFSLDPAAMAGDDGKPWQVKTGLPRNLVSQKPYRGINVFLLMAMNYESPNWLTLRQANQLGGQIKPGEKSCPVVFWKPMKVKDRESGEDRKIPFLRLYHVFNVAQCTGLKNLPPADDSAFIQSLPAELVANMPQRPVIKHGMALASYSPVTDVVNMPDHARFESDDRYHATLFHELVHATGHATRLKRPGIMEPKGYGSEPYGKEELVAEMGSAFLCGYSGIEDRTIDSSAAYLEGWLKQLQQDKTLIVHAAAQAQRAVDFILGKLPEEGSTGVTENATPPPMVAEVCA